MLCVSGTSQDHGKATAWLYTQDGVVFEDPGFYLNNCEHMFLIIEILRFCDMCCWYLCDFKNEKFVWKFTVLHLPFYSQVSRTVCFRFMVSTHSLLIKTLISRLFLWKMRSLSFDGWLTLCKLVIGSLDSYWFSLFKASEKVIKTFARIWIIFFWGVDLDNRKLT